MQNYLETQNYLVPCNKIKPCIKAVHRLPYKNERVETLNNVHPSTSAVDEAIKLIPLEDYAVKSRFVLRRETNSYRPLLLYSH